MIKNYKVENKMMGPGFDGGGSSLASDANVMAAPEPEGGVLEQDPHNPLNLAQPGRWSKLAQDDYGKVMAGQAPIVNGWMDQTLRSWGYDPARVGQLSDGKRRKLVNKLVREIKRKQDLIYESVTQQVAEFGVASLSPGYVPGGRNEHMVHDSNFRGALPQSFFQQDANRRERTALHVRLRAWNAGPLVLERPQGSSLHHLADYDAGNGPQPEKIRSWFDDRQIVLVENDWGRAVPQIEGEWRVPFAFICWEFRISGVRVLAFTEADREPAIMWCVYGADGHWVVDDYRYELGCPALPRGIAKRDVDAHELRRVAKMCYDTIRASCIMMDARVAHQDKVAASVKLAERRAREGRAPLRDHYVVRLLNSERRAHVARSRGASAHVETARAAQRGHWRKGTWVHYDDQDSGQVQYTNDGGFVVSKTWRRWHFAGDPKNIIHKEYRL